VTTHTAVIRIPTAPQYSYVELQIQGDTLADLEREADAISNRLIAKLALVVEVGFVIGKHNPDELAIKAGMASPEVPADSDDDAVETVKQELGATVVEQFATPAPWEKVPEKDSRPAPPWAAAPTPVKSAPAGFDDF